MCCLSLRLRVIRFASLATPTHVSPDGADGTSPRLCRRSNTHFSKSIFIQLHPIPTIYVGITGVLMLPKHINVGQRVKGCGLCSLGMLSWLLIRAVLAPDPSMLTFSDGVSLLDFDICLQARGHAPSKSGPGSKLCPGTLRSRKPWGLWPDWLSSPSTFRAPGLTRLKD